MDENKRLIDITIDDLRRIIIETVGRANIKIYEEIESRMNREAPKEVELKGIAGVMIALNCSRSKAYQLRKDGYLEGGYKMVGKTLIIPDPDKLRAVVDYNCHKRKDTRVGRRINYSLIHN